MRVAIDGVSVSGLYRVDCECGTNWHGRAERASLTSWSPALPVAEVHVHQRLAHPLVAVDIRFSKRFADWLQEYWEHVNKSRSTGVEHSRQATVH